ncbi:MAG: SpoIIE family protein phosphatase [Roseburia sp.]|nr:SpoIIE family protein phosphatase [Roseburia sp.]MCM1096685.1 SpoIIE family protein phosphatase [Ruminococcus flavefaciens]
MRTEERELRTAQVSDLCRRKLLNYADSFYELARSYDREFRPESGDRQAVLSERRLWESRQILKSHLNEMARIMTDVACEVLCYRPMEEKKKRLLTHAMREEGIRVEQPCYLSREDGGEAVVLTMSTDKKPGFPAEEAADMISVLLNRRLRLSSAGPFSIGRTPHSFILEREARFLVLTGFSRAIRENETVSGDNYAVLGGEREKLTVMLSDGTGSGERAGRDSEQVLDLMEKFLEAGYSTEAAVRMINSALFALGEDRNHPTLDICDINLSSGACELLKIGGAATFLKRGREVEQLAEGSLPLGIFQQAQADPIRRELTDGDYLIMVSDGVIDAFGELDYENTMSMAVAGITEQNPGEIADRLLREALVAAGGRIRDDMTIGVVGVWEMV